VIRSLDSEQPVANISAMDELLVKSTVRSRFNTFLLTIFAVVAMVLSAVGIYGVMSYSVTQRTHEIGVRMALGAQHGDVLKLVVRQGIMMGIVGIIAGLFGAYGLTRLLATLLFGITATDALTFVTVSVGLLLIVLVACLVPARRATKIDPLV